MDKPVDKVYPKENPRFQHQVDRLVARAVLWAIPVWIRPNYVTVLRFVLTPVVILMLYYHFRWLGLALFMAAVVTDFVDGTMARTRDQITKVGIIIDPVADKLLVASVLGYVGFKYLVVKIILAVIVAEMILVAIGATVALRTRGQPAAANVFGKSKMVIQSIALILFLIAGILSLNGLLNFSVYLLWAAMAFAVLSGIKQIRDVYFKRSTS